MGQGSKRSAGLAYPIIWSADLGVKYLFLQPDAMVDEILFGGSICAFRHLEGLGIQIPKNTTVVDAGSHFGGLSIPLAVSNPTVTIHAFEPQPQLFYNLCANMAVNGIKNIIPHNVACSSAAGTVYWKDKYQTWNPGSTRMSHIRADHLDSSAPSVKIDDFNLKNVSLMKIDVEGMEELVVNGAMETIIRNKPKILLESWSEPQSGHDSPTRERIVKLLGSHGYQYEFTENDIFFY